MSGQAGILISHSSSRDLAANGDQGPTAILLDELQRKLKSAGYDVLYDRQLRKGEEWRPELHTWMGVCDAAVLLLSKAALEQSPWVLKEATVFFWRRSLQRDFVVIPVLLPGISQSDLTKGNFAAVELNVLQAAIAKDTSDPADVARAAGQSAPSSPTCA